MTDETITFAGRPVHGEINHYSEGTTEQRPTVEFVIALDDLLHFPEVEAVRWEQYTPYFNDGEACEFGTGDIHVKFVGEGTGGESDDGFRDHSGVYPPGYFHTHEYKHLTRRYNAWTNRYEATDDSDPAKLKVDYRDRRYFVNGEIRADIEAAHKALNSALGSGAYHVKLNEVFGDPAQVTATRDGFTVEHYEHD